MSSGTSGQKTSSKPDSYPNGNLCQRLIQTQFDQPRLAEFDYCSPTDGYFKKKISFCEKQSSKKNCCKNLRFSEPNREILYSMFWI